VELVNVSAIIVTRADHDLTPLLTSLLSSPVEEILIWDNSGEVTVEVDREPRIKWLNYGGPDLAVYGRYAAIEHANGDLIYVQDDDCVLPPESIEKLMTGMLDANSVHPAEIGYVVCNQPVAFRHSFYEEHSLVGFGAVFHRDAPKRAFDRWYGTKLSGEGRGKNGEIGLFKRTCDIVFTALTPRVLVDVSYENLPWADSPDRMYRQREHVAERTRMLELVRKVRDA
jgi:hypothetical protein